MYINLLRSTTAKYALNAFRLAGKRRFSLGTIPKLRTMSGAGMLLGLTIGTCSLKTLQAVEAPSSPYNKVKKGLSQKELKSLLDNVDSLFDTNKMEEGLAVLEKYSDSDEAEILWRLARFVYKVGKFHTPDEGDQLEMADKAVAYGERALLADSNNFACHKWSGIIISWSSGFYGTKKKIERSFDVQEHFVRAIELNPKDPTSRHLLGQWCYSVSNVPWYQKKIATVVFATPPYSTYEEALSHFQAAEELEPGFYSTNWLFLGKCYLQLGKVGEGGTWLKKTASYVSDIEEDNEAKREATELLNKLGIKLD